jgi:CBS domain-containing protein
MRRTIGQRLDLHQVGGCSGAYAVTLPDIDLDQRNSSGRAQSRHQPQEDAMQAQDVMATNVTSVQPDTGLADAIEIMIERHISGLPVIDSAGRLVGVLTEGDLLRRAETGTQPRHGRWFDFFAGPGRLAGEYVRTHGRRVEDLMTDTVVAVAPEATLTELVELMESKRIKRVPVLRDGVVVGIVSRADLLRPLLRALKAAAQQDPVTDSAIHDAITVEFARQKWGTSDLVRIEVVDGAVVLEGTIYDNRDRAAMIVAARNVPGVTAVCDELTWMEPVTGAAVGPMY